MIRWGAYGLEGTASVALQEMPDSKRGREWRDFWK